MRENTTIKSRRARKAGRRHPLATAALLAIGLAVTGGSYAALSATTATAETDMTSQQVIDQGEKLFQANCASCHGLAAAGTEFGPSLAGVGAASAYFQISTGRMPMAMSGPQAQQKPVQFTPEAIDQLTAYVASLGPGPGLPDAQVVDGKGDASLGGELFRINCAMCHNVAGAGGALTEGKFAPALGDVSGVNMYNAMVTGPQNMPVFNDMNITPEQKRDIITYLKYLQDEQSPGGFDLGSLGPVSEGLFIWIFGLGGIVALTVWITAKSN